MSNESSVMSIFVYMHVHVGQGGSMSHSIFVNLTHFWLRSHSCEVINLDRSVYIMYARIYMLTLLATDTLVEMGE